MVYKLKLDDGTIATCESGEWSHEDEEMQADLNAFYGAEAFGDVFPQPGYYPNPEGMMVEYAAKELDAEIIEQPGDDELPGGCEDGK